MDALRTLADHVLDVAQNSVNAGAKFIDLQFLETENDIFLEIKDDGKGMNQDIFLNVFDPFFTTQNKSKKIGLGLPFLKQNAELTGGYVELKSKEGIGTILKAKFIKNIDCPPLGDLAGTFASLVTSSRKVNWHVLRCLKENCYSFSTDMLEGVDLTSPKVIKGVFEYFENMESKIRKSGGGKGAHNS